MKNKMVLAGMVSLLLAFGVLTIGCDNGSTDPGTTTKIYAAVAKNCNTYVFPIESNSRSARVLTEGNTYEFKVIIPKNNSGGPGVAAFDTAETIIVTAKSKDTGGGSGKEKWTLERADDQKIIYVTFENSTITKINGPGISGNAYAETDPFIPIGNNKNGLDGAWFGYGSDGVCYNFTIDGNTLTVIKEDDFVFKFDLSSTPTHITGTNHHNWDFTTGEYIPTTEGEPGNSHFEDAPYSLSPDKNTLTVDMGEGDEVYARIILN